ncbi:hypothetical protein ACWEF6_02510 [Amycolatopsis sp. NPDC004772]
MSALITAPSRLTDFDNAAGKLKTGHWIALPYEAYGQLDRGEWNDELVRYLAEREVRADVIDIPKKSVAVLINVDWAPTFEQIVESVTAVEHRRMTGT